MTADNIVKKKTVTNNNHKMNSNRFQNSETWTPFQCFRTKFDNTQQPQQQEEKTNSVEICLFWLKYELRPWYVHVNDFPFEISWIGCVLPKKNFVYFIDFSKKKKNSLTCRLTNTTIRLFKWGKENKNILFLELISKISSNAHSPNSIIFNEIADNLFPNLLCIFSFRPPESFIRFNYSLQFR